MENKMETTIIGFIKYAPVEPFPEPTFFSASSTARTSPEQNRV